MENFVVSARKYRPVTFDTVIGQKSITGTLKNAIRNKQLAQAFLFCGPRGVGKTTCARILAKTINCENPTENVEACNECESCTSFNNSASFNIHELDAASNNTVDDIRNLVDQVRIPPQVGEYKVYIIDEVHMLSQQAFNAFLKTLEEPPPYAKFILATTEKHKIIPTILSRCQIFDFKRITVEDIARHLQYVASNEHVTASDDALHIIAQKADGALRDALSIFDQLVSFAGDELTYEKVILNLNVLDYDYYFRIIQHILKGDASGTLLIINEIIANGFDGQHFIIGLGEHLRNLLVCRDPDTSKLLEVSDNLKKRYLDQSGHCTTDFLLRSLDIINRCDVEYKNSNNKRLNLELALLQMCALMGYPSGSGPATEKKSTELPSPDSRPAEPAPRKPAAVKKVPEAASNATAAVQEGSRVEEQPPKINKAEPVEGNKTNDPADDAIVGHVSIKNASRKLNGDKNKKESEEAREPRNKTDVTQDDLVAAWKSGIPVLCKHSKNLLSSLQSKNPVLKNDYIVEITADSKVLEREIKDLLPGIKAYLKKELNNDFLDLRIVLADISEQKDKAYFPDEIYKKMTEKNPEIKNLRDQLDLEIDF